MPSAVRRTNCQGIRRTTRLPAIPYGPGKTPLMLALSRMSPFLPAAIIA